MIGGITMSKKSLKMFFCSLIICNMLSVSAFAHKKVNQVKKENWTTKINSNGEKKLSKKDLKFFELYNSKILKTEGKAKGLKEEKNQVAINKRNDIGAIYFDYFFENSGMDKNEFGKQKDFAHERIKIKDNKTDVHHLLVYYIKFREAVDKCLREHAAKITLQEYIQLQLNMMQMFLEPSLNGGLSVYGSQYFTATKNVKVFMQHILKNINKIKITKENFKKNRNFLVNMLEERLALRKLQRENGMLKHEKKRYYKRFNNGLIENMKEIKEASFKKTQRVEKDFKYKSKFRYEEHKVDKNLKIAKN